MTLSDISIKKPVFAWMLMFGLIVFGAISYTFMGISQLPDVDFPVVTVAVSWPGAAFRRQNTRLGRQLERKSFGPTR